jgi:pimeloyl-ACP methyl ester carboxylesterase
MERPLVFEPDGFRLFAMAHRPSERGAPVGVVVCHPYGEEKQLSYPVLVRFARLLERDGFPVLRFDCRGHGDSQGDVEDATIETHVTETLAAARVAREVLEVRDVVLLGLRLGASVAVRAAEREPTTAGLVLWSPIVKGAQYLEEMIRKRLFADMLAKRKPSREQILGELAQQGRLEIEGNFLGRRMSEEMATIDLPAEVGSFRNPVLVTGIKSLAHPHAPYEALARAYEAAGTACAFAGAGTQPFWERSAMYERYFPEDLFELTRRWMRERWQRT